MFEYFNITTKKHWSDAFGFLTWTLIGGIIPLWFSPLILALISARFGIGDFVDHAELALYSAALLSPAFFLVLRDKDACPFPYRRLFSLALIIGLLVSAGCFTAVIASNSFDGKIIVLNKYFLRWVTGILFAISVFLYFLVTALDNAIAELDPAMLLDAAAKKLGVAYDNTAGKTK